MTVSPDLLPALPFYRGRTVICAYSIEDIDRAFHHSKLKGYSSSFIGSRPGMVRQTLFPSQQLENKNITEKKNMKLNESAFISKAKRLVYFWRMHIYIEEAILKSLSKDVWSIQVPSPGQN